MRKLSYILLLLVAISIEGQVGINTQTPETALEVVGRAKDTLIGLNLIYYSTT